MAFDFAIFMDDNGLSYSWYDETNITFDCPYCGKGKRHFVVSVDSSKPVFHCFKCDERGGWVRLVSELLKISLNAAEDIVYGKLNFNFFKPPVKVKKELKLPSNTGWVKGALEYLANRGIDNDLIDRHKLYFTMIPPYGWRIIIPVFYKNRPVAFQARTIFDTVEPRYKNPPAIEIRDYLYGYDRMDPDRKVVIVEGPFDYMALSSRGENCVAVFGKDISDSQLSLLIEDGVKDIALMFDDDAMGSAMNLSFRLKPYFRSIEIIPIIEGDPADSINEIHPTLSRMEVLKKMTERMRIKLDKRISVGIA